MDNAEEQRINNAIAVLWHYSRTFPKNSRKNIGLSLASQLANDIHEYGGATTLTLECMEGFLKVTAPTKTGDAALDREGADNDH